MAYYECAKTVTLTAGADLRNAIYEALTVDASGQVVQASATTAHVIGALAGNPIGSSDTTGMAVQVAVVGGGGVLKIKAGGAITAGQLVVPSATAGRVSGVADIGSLAEDQMAIGVALEDAADGDVFSVLAQTIAAPHSV